MTPLVASKDIEVVMNAIFMYFKLLCVLYKSVANDNDLVNVIMIVSYSLMFLIIYNMVQLILPS